METQTKINIEHEIIELLSKNNTSRCTFHFNTVELDSGENQLLLFSYNPLHNSSFLLHEETAHNENKCYEKMLKFIKELPQSQDLKHYEIVWYNDEKGGQKESSHFFGYSEFDALKKLYSTRDKSEVRFESMTLRPNA